MRLRRRWVSIQYLRGFAALFVVIFHICATTWTFNPFHNFKAGAHGVDVFFVISGFVMYTAARDQDVRTFCLHRIIRVVPLYWIATLAMVAVHLFLTGNPVSRLNIIKSIGFVPFYNPSFDNQVWPVLVPGWTLNYEMFFYGLFGLTLAIRRPLALVWFVLPALVGLGYRFPIHNALWQTYTSPLLLEFAAGLAIGCAVVHADLRRLAALLPLGVIALLLSDLSTPSILYVGGASSAIVIGALALEVGGKLPSWRWAESLGDASYSLYLVHTLVIDLCERGFKIATMPDTGRFPFFAVIALAASLALGFAIHFLLEKPLTRWLGRGGAGRPSYVRRSA